jgi:thiol-disulfide isomerase/thioredoxin
MSPISLRPSPLLYSALRTCGTLKSSIPSHPRTTLFHPGSASASFSRTSRKRTPAARIYQTVRRPSELETLLLLNASSRTTLLTLWTASWCRTCRTVGPIVREVVEEHSDAQAQNGKGDVAFVEVEFDAPENAELGARYMVS